MWFIPIFCISILYNGYYTNELIKEYISEFFKENSSLKYICYEKYSLYLINKCYYQIIMIISIFVVTVVSLIILSQIFNYNLRNISIWRHGV